MTTGYRTSVRNGRGILEHRAIVEASIGRGLCRDELIHHKNGDKKDNRLSNLVIVSKKEHAKLHAIEKRKYSDDELLNPIRSYYKMTGFRPTAEQFRQFAEIHPRTVEFRFGTWNHAIAIALNTKMGRLSHRGTAPLISNEVLIEDYRRLLRKLGHRPTTTEYIKLGRFHVNTMLHRFHTWEALHSAAKS